MFVDIEIRKPLYHNFVRIRDKYINQAIREGKQLRIKIPQGVGIHDPAEWKRTGKRVEQVFLIPDRPMILFGNYVNYENYGEKKNN